MNLYLPARIERLDARITAWMADNGVLLTRVGLGICFVWFGVLKFFPHMSPAEDLAGRTIEKLSFGLIGRTPALYILAPWEVAIGVGLLSGKFLRATLFLLFVQMAGTVTPLFLFPSETFQFFPYAPTLEGQYIIKNLVLVAAGLVIGATVRGGYLRSMPPSVRSQRWPVG
jgi:uncharacterized membrane protein YphA (DoxX/SURF4 family)